MKKLKLNFKTATVEDMITSRSGVFYEHANKDTIKSIY